MYLCKREIELDITFDTLLYSIQLYYIEYYLKIIMIIWKKI